MVFDLSYEAASVMGRRSLERSPKAWIAVEYRPEASLSIWVPSEMQERYPYTRATAWYSSYRRFSVGTTESFQVQK
jgi:hypothetical protein